MAMHIPPSLAHVDGETLLRYEERVSIAIKKAELFITEAKESNCAHLVDSGLLEDLRISRQAMFVAEKELIRRSTNN